MAEFLNQNDRRTHYCGTVTEQDIGKEVCVMGWTQRQRDLGALIFIDLRDRTGIVQLAFDDTTDRAIFDKAFGIRSEYVLCAHGTVRPRGEGAINPNLPTGKVEIFVTELKILSAAQTPPFEVNDNKLSNVQFFGGCNGNLKGIAALVEGMDVDTVIERVQGITCGMKKTSCPDQLAQALKAAIANK